VIEEENAEARLAETIPAENSPGTVHVIPPTDNLSIVNRVAPLPRERA
jgi:hypothetical protein